MIQSLFVLHIFTTDDLRLQIIIQTFQQNVRIHIQRLFIFLIDNNEMIRHHQIKSSVFFLGTVVFTYGDPVFGKSRKLNGLKPKFQFCQRRIIVIIGKFFQKSLPVKPNVFAGNRLFFLIYLPFRKIHRLHQIQGIGCHHRFAFHRSLDYLLLFLFCLCLPGCLFTLSVPFRILVFVGIKKLLRLQRAIAAKPKHNTGQNQQKTDTSYKFHPITDLSYRISCNQYQSIPDFYSGKTILPL